MPAGSITLCRSTRRRCASSFHFTLWSVRLGNSPAWCSRWRGSQPLGNWAGRQCGMTGATCAVLAMQAPTPHLVQHRLGLGGLQASHLFEGRLVCLLHPAPAARGTRVRRLRRRVALTTGAWTGQRGGAAAARYSTLQLGGLLAQPKGLGPMTVSRSAPPAACDPLRCIIGIVAPGSPFQGAARPAGSWGHLLETAHAIAHQPSAAARAPIGLCNYRQASEAESHQ